MKTTSFKRLLAMLMATLLMISMVTSALSVELQWDKAAYDTAVTDLSSQTTENTIEATSEGFAFSVAGQLPAQAKLDVSTWDAETTAYIRTDILGLPELEEGMTEHAFDITILSGTQEWQPNESVTVDITGLDVDEDTEVLVFHIPDNTPAVATFSLMAETETAAAYEVVENVTVGEGKITFLAEGFSTYYIVAGSTTHSRANDQYYILPGTTVNITNVENNRYTISFPDGKTADECGIAVTYNNNTLTFATSANATIGTYVVTGTYDSYNWWTGQTTTEEYTVTIYVSTPQSIFELPGLTNDVFLSLDPDSTTIPDEPMAGGDENWVYVRSVNANGEYTFGGWSNTPFLTSYEGFLDIEEIASSPYLEQNLKGQNVIGVIDRGNGDDTLPCVTWNDEQWHDLLKQYVDAGYDITISDGKGGSISLDEVENLDEKLADGKYRYRIYPYVIKLIQGNNQPGWHVDCSVVDRQIYWVAYEYNLPSNAVVTGTLTRPERTFYVPKTTGIKVGVMKLNNADVVGEKEVEVYDSTTMTTSKYKFLYWNTEADGSGSSYDPNDTLPEITSDVTLYAIWDQTQTSGTVKLTKSEVFEDSNDGRKDDGASYNFTVNFENAASDGVYPYAIHKANGTTVEGENITAVDSITLANGEYIIIQNAPAGKLTVTETVAENAGYVPSWKVGGNTVTTETTPNVLTATVAAGVQTQIECINTYAPLTADLIITKTVTDADTTDAITPDSNQEFQFEVTLDGEEYSENPVTVKSDEPVTIPAIRIGTEYTIKEINIPVGYENTTANLNENDELAGTIVGGENANTVTFTNTFKVADLTITKDVVGASAPTDAKFSFTVNLTGDNNAVLTGYTFAGDVEGTLGTDEIELGDGETVTISGIPINAAYAIVETADNLNAYTVTIDGAAEKNEVTATATGTIGADGVDVTYTNTYKTGVLTIQKSGLQSNESAIFVIMKDGKEYQRVVVTGTSLSVQLPQGEYTVKEENWSWGYTIDPDTETANVDDDGDTVSFSNTRKEQWLYDEAGVKNILKETGSGKETIKE